MPHATATPRPRAVKSSDGVDAVRSVFKEDGCVVIQKLLNADQVATMNAEIDIPISKMTTESTKADPNVQDFHGLQTKRFTNLATHSKVFSE